MPEGPEIRRAADQVDRALRGRKAEVVFFAFPHLKGFERELRGQRVRAVEPRGKALLTRFESGWTVFSHNQLYGRWYVTRSGKPPDTRRSLRFAVRNQAQTAWLYSASQIEVHRDRDLPRQPYLASLGPDALDPALDEKALRAHLRNPRFARSDLATLLLRQDFVAGIGNYLRSEVLHVARLHPHRRLGDLEASEVRRLAAALLAVTRRAYETGGVTNDPRRARKLELAGVPRRDYRHHVFTRWHAPCFVCGTPIERVRPAGRKLDFCPTCQPERPRG